MQTLRLGPITLALSVVMLGSITAGILWFAPGCAQMQASVLALIRRRSRSWLARGLHHCGEGERV